MTTPVTSSDGVRWTRVNTIQFKTSAQVFSLVRFNFSHSYFLYSWMLTPLANSDWGTVEGVQYAYNQFETSGYLFSAVRFNQIRTKCLDFLQALLLRIGLQSGEIQRKYSGREMARLKSWQAHRAPDYTHISTSRHY